MSDDPAAAHGLSVHISEASRLHHDGISFITMSFVINWSHADVSLWFFDAVKIEMKIKTRTLDGLCSMCGWGQRWSCPEDVHTQIVYKQAHKRSPRRVKSHTMFIHFQNKSPQLRAVKHSYSYTWELKTTFSPHNLSFKDSVLSCWSHVMGRAALSCCCGSSGPAGSLSSWCDVQEQSLQEREES